MSAAQNHERIYGYPHVHREDIASLEASLGYEFKRPELLVQALTHRSYVNENDGVALDNQRMEFLGDSVLGVITAEALYRQDINAPEGVLSTRQSQIVCEDALAEIAIALRLGEFIRLGKGECATGGRDKKSVLSDAYEAVLCAVYLDGGMEAAREVVERLQSDAIAVLLQEPVVPGGAVDPKSLLQQVVQGEASTRPHYVIVEESGPPHLRVFVSEVRVGARILAQGQGRSKKQAEQEAAAIALTVWNQKPGSNEVVGETDES